jgi:translation initiation factor IF-3
MAMRRFDPRQAQRGPQIRINQRIRVPEIRVIGEDGEMLGVMQTHEALRRAQERGLDLVEVNPKADPPVCKILDFGKYKYDEKKKARETKRKQSTVEVKEIKLRPKTDEHDLDFKARRARTFLETGNKVKFTVRFRGREITHPHKAREQLLWMQDQFLDVANTEVRPSMEGRTMTMIMSPKPAILQDLAQQRAAQEKERKEAEAARKAKRTNSSPGKSQPDGSSPGDSDPDAVEAGGDNEDGAGGHAGKASARGESASRRNKGGKAAAKEAVAEK